MKVLMISGSRNAEGQTARAADSLLAGAAKAGAETEKIFLPDIQLERCRQCEDSGWGICRDEGRCIIEDDFPSLMEKVRQADAVVFATPVYFGDLSESLRAFLDRLRRICIHKEGRAGIEHKPAIGLCVAGGGGGGAPACCVSLERALTTSKLDVVDMIPVRRQNLEEKQAALELTGQWLAERRGSS